MIEHALERLDTPLVALLIFAGLVLPGLVILCIAAYTNNQEIRSGANSTNFIAARDGAVVVRGSNGGTVVTGNDKNKPCPYCGAPSE